MGWKSTLEITRDEAIAEIYVLLERATNESLENILDELSNDQFDVNNTAKYYGHNFRIRSNRE